MLQYGRASAEKSRQSHHPAGRYQPDFHGPGVRQPQALSTLFGERRGAQALKLPILSGANRSRNQHGARSGAGLAYILVRFADGAASGRKLTTPHTVAREV